MLALLIAACSTPSFGYEVTDVAAPAAPANLAADASLDEGAWTVENGAEISADALRTGPSGARIRRADDATDPRVVGPSFPAAPGRHVASGWLRTSMPPSADPNYSAVLEVEWSDAGGGELGSERVAAVNGVTHVWVYRERAVTAPAGTASGRFSFRFNWSSTGLAELDDVALTPATEMASAGPPVEVTLRAAERIFEPGAPLAVNASVRARQGPPQNVELHMDVYDSRGKLLTSGQAQCEARSDRPVSVTIEAAEAEIPIREHLRAHVTTLPASALAQEFGMVVIPRPTDFSLDETSTFAILVGHSYTKRWLGARWERPNFNWNEREMELAKRYGVIYVGMINQANQALDRRISLEEYGAFVEESVAKFKHLVKYWQLGNEPHLYQPGIPERWAEVLKVGYEAAKRADPECQVMWGGITGLNVDPDMVDKLLAAGGGDYTDIIDIHLYVPIPQMDALLTKVRADMAKHGVDKPITITEVTGQLGTPMPERVKASHVYKRFAVAEAHGVLASWWFVMHWVNTGEFRYCSLIDPGTGEPHEGAAAYARFSHALEGAEFARRIDAGEGMHVYEWAKGDRSIFVAWAEGTGAQGYAQLPCGTGAGTLVDVAGHEWPVSVGGGLGVDLRDEPLLLDLPSGTGTRRDTDGPAIEDLSLARGSGTTVRNPVPRGEIRVPDGIMASPIEDGELSVTAAPGARIGADWVVFQARDGGVDTSFARMRVDVTESLALDMTPVPGDPASVTWRVTNLSPDPISADVTVQSPVSDALRPQPSLQRIADLAPGETAEAQAPMPIAASSLARYDCVLRVETDKGAADRLMRTLVFTPARRMDTAPTIDGALDDWPGTFPIEVGPDTGETHHATDGAPSDPDDLSATAALTWDDENLYMAVRVRDDIHTNDQGEGALWDGDGLQFGFAPDPYTPSSAYYEWGLALTDDGPQTWAWRAVAPQPTGPIDFPYEITRSDSETIYEAAIPWRMIPPIAPVAGTTFGFGLCVNEKDTANRAYYGWHAGIAGEKDRARFGQVTLMGD